MSTYHRRVIRWFIAIAIPLVILGCGGSVHDTAPADPTVVKTQQGQVKGVTVNGVREFLDRKSVV